MVTEKLRSYGVVGAFVEFAGDGLAGLSLADRATISNMSPEFGATATLFPIDDETLAYLRMTGRSADRVALVERYAKEQGLWRDPGFGPDFDAVVDLDLGAVVPSLAGPRRPQDRVPLEGLQADFEANFPNGPNPPMSADVEALPLVEGVVEVASADSFPASDAPSYARGGEREQAMGSISPALVSASTTSYPAVQVQVGALETSIRTGSVAIAAITSCTNTSNPTVMIGAGLLARNAVARGLTVGPTVKTSLAPAPGRSRVISRRPG